MDFRRDEVGEAIARLAVGLLNLLAQEMKSGERLGSRFVRVELHVLTDAIGGEQSIDTAWLKQLLADNFVEQLLRVGEEFAGFLAMFLVVQDCRIAAAQFPGVEERGPIDEGDEGGE